VPEQEHREGGEEKRIFDGEQAGESRVRGEHIKAWLEKKICTLLVDAYPCKRRTATTFAEAFASISLDSVSLISMDLILVSRSKSS